MTVLSLERVGRVTASRVPLILGLAPASYGGPRKVLREMVRQHFHAVEDAPTEAMLRGTDLEDEALAAYEAVKGQLTYRPEETVVHPSVPWLAATPDAYVGLSGLVQIKCPMRARYSHVADRPDIAAQMQCEMACTSRSWNDLFIYRPGSDAEPSTLLADPDWLDRHYFRLQDFINTYARIIADETLAAPFLVDRKRRQP